MRKFLAAFCGPAVILVGLASPTHAVDWGQTQIDDIIDDVREIRRQATGNGPIKRVADDFKAQLDEMVAKGFVLKESVGDILNWLKSREGPYRDFVGSPRCSRFTECGEFRNDLRTFFTEFASLRDNFPIMQRLGVGDGSHAISVIDEAPPVVLFGLYQTMGRLPGWQSLPSDLQAIYDEVGDPDVFALDSLAPSSLSPASANSSSVRTNSAASLGVLSETPTQRFCSNRARAIDRERDPVRMNRLKFFVFSIRQGLGLVEALTSETIGANIVGEGTETIIPNPLKAQIKMVLVVFDVVERGVQTFQANLEICRKNNREIEMQVAQCIPLVNVVMPGARDDIYTLVRTKIDSAFDDGLFVDLSEFWMATADNQREAGEFREAFESLCSAYRTIGAACNGNCQPNPGGGGRRIP